MARRKISNNIETEVLMKCRRRCCICYGLSRDGRLKQGQIAHLDHNPENNTADNLAFLCLDHHDQYDSRTSQSKKLTNQELRSFRDELYDHVKETWGQPPKFEDVNADIYSGNYVRDGEFEDAELNIKYIGNNLIQVKGCALWGKTRDFGPNIGELDFVAEVHSNKVVFTDKLVTSDREYKLELTFWGHKLTAKEDYVVGYFGMNAHFEGEYYKLK
jgi:hypothetical protein